MGTMSQSGSHVRNHAVTCFCETRSVCRLIDGVAAHGSCDTFGSSKKKRKVGKRKREKEMKGWKKGREKRNGRNMNLVAFGSNREKRLTLIDSSASSPRTHLEVPVV